jgi:YesN/AraC family two-component response regulator
MEDYNKIIESLGIKYNKSKNIKIIQSVSNENFYDVENSVFLVHNGELRFGPEKELVKKGDVLFIPGGKNIPITYGSPAGKSSAPETYHTRKESFLQSIHYSEISGTNQENFSYITFEAKVFDSVNFYASLDIPAFIIRSEKISALIRSILAETESTESGHERVVKATTELLVIEITRYIIKEQLFVEKLATNITYFKDPRLIDIFTYIKENLQGDLSNQALSNVANVSEDYVGQYFKMLTGINPQDYIEYQRMERAVNLLRTTKRSIREIGRDVGYKDTAYFCRRFKMMFGIPAGKMRRRESLMNI